MPTKKLGNNFNSENNLRGSKTKKKSVRSNSSPSVKKKSQKTKGETQPSLKMKLANFTKMAPLLSLKKSKKTKEEEEEEEDESRREYIVEKLKRLKRTEVLEIYKSIELIEELEVKVYDSSNIGKFTLENKTDFNLDHIKDPVEMQKIISNFKSVIEKSQRCIIKVIKPANLPYKYFFKSSGTSRGGADLKGIYLPLDKIPIEFNYATLSFRFLKPEDEFIYSMDETKYNSKDGITLESIEMYSRFINEINARICKTLYEKEQDKNIIWVYE